MAEPTPPTRKQGLTAIDGALALIVLLLIVQMWLLTATLEAYLAGHHEAALPAAVISALLFVVCAGLYLFVARIDAEAGRARSNSNSAANEPSAEAAAGSPAADR